MPISAGDEQMKKDNWANYMKGIAIISVVLGHCYRPAAKFVYMYHLAIFMFVAGYLYNEVKYGKDPFLHLVNRGKATLSQYWGYTLVLMLLHNPMVKLGLYNPETYQIYNGVDYIINMSSAVTMEFFEPAGAAFWFLKFYLLALVIWGFIVFYATKLETLWIIRGHGVEKESHIKDITIAIVSVVLGGCGVYLIEKSAFIAWRIEDSFLLMPIVALGYYYKKYKLKIEKWVNGIGACIALIIVLYAVYYNQDTYIELSQGRIISPLIFYLVTVSGIYFWTYVSVKLNQVVEMLKLKLDLLAEIGKQSFDIMAMHIVVIKMVDYIYLSYINPNAGEMSAFVYSVESLWPIYLSLGCVLPVLLRKGMEKVKFEIYRLVDKKASCY